MALHASRRRLLEVEALEPRYAPSGTPSPLHGSIQLAPSSAAEQPNSGGVMVYTGTATLTSARTGTLTGTFTETIRPRHAHGKVHLTVSGHGDTFVIQLLERYRPTTGATQADLSAKVSTPASHSVVLGSATGHTNFATGAAQLTFNTSPIRL